jgi:hypothetical protein
VFPSLRGQCLLFLLSVEQGWQVSHVPTSCLYPPWLPVACDFVVSLL